MEDNNDIETLPNCFLPDVPDRELPDDISSQRVDLIRWIEKKWVNGTKLEYYYFRDGRYSTEDVESQIEKVEEAFDAWRELGIGIEFEETDSIGASEVRISFDRDGSAWSYLGRDVVDIPGQHEPTMHFGWDLNQDPRGVDVPIHEIGHTLGFPHEHQNPLAGIDWDEEAVYEYFSGPPNNWERSRIDHNILNKYPAGSIEGSDWDPNSVMHYSFQAALIDGPDPYDDQGITPDGGISTVDKDRARIFYPAQDDDDLTALEPYKSQSLSLGPGEQRNFVIEPDATRKYTIQTFGRSDTVMVLFEEQNGELRYVKGDDDSGTDRNARITRRLFSGRRYVLRIRLYLNWGTADTAVMLW